MSNITHGALSHAYVYKYILFWSIPATWW